MTKKSKKKELECLLVSLKNQIESSKQHHLSMVEFHCGKIKKEDIKYCEELGKRMEKKFISDYKKGLIVYG
jgi:hypothetical protein